MLLPLALIYLGIGGFLALRIEHQLRDQGHTPNPLVTLIMTFVWIIPLLMTLFDVIRFIYHCIIDDRKSK